MRKSLVVAGVCTLTAAVALAATDSRYVVEEGSDGYVTVGTAPHLLVGQDRTLLVPTVCTSGSCTRAPPSGCNPEGLRTGVALGVRARICALPALPDGGGGAGGGALTGGGSVEVWSYDDKEAGRTGCDAGWGVSPAFTYTMSASGTRCENIDDLWAPYGGINGTRVVLRPVNVTVDGGQLEDGGNALIIKLVALCPATGGC